MIEYRIANRNENREILRLANHVFQGIGVPIDFETSLPKVYGHNMDSSSIHYVAADDTRGLLGTVATLPEILHIGDESLSIGYIGTVSVHPDARGEGHMRMLMNLSKEKAVQEGMDFLILGGQKQRYAYYGFETAGLYYESEVSSSNIRHGMADCSAERVDFEEIMPESSSEKKAKAFQEDQWFYVERKQFVTCCRSYHSKPYAALENGSFLGYVVQKDNSFDLSEIMAVSEEAERKIIKAWLQQHKPDVFRLIIPGWNTPQLRRVAAIAECIRMSTDHRILLIHWKNTVEKLLRLKAMGTHLNDGKMELDIAGEQFTITVSDGIPYVQEGTEHPLKLNAREAERMMFDPFAMESQTNWFPLPIYLSMADQF